MQTRKNIYLMLLVLLLGHTSLPSMALAAERPRIGLVLGGGGARGTAHIGVLEVMEKLRVPIDCIAGTSMGSLIAGAYASGLNPQQMKDRLAPVDWNDLFEDNPSNAEANYRDRRLSKSYYPGLELGMTENGVLMASGVVSGQKIKLFFNTLVGSDKGEINIESLPIPLSVIATDIGTGERVAFRSGELSAAMRASMSVPAVLSPVAHQGRHLVDGGLVDNLPVSEVKSLCQADIVIAVDVGTPLAKPEDVRGLASVTGQMIGILTEQNAIASRALLKPSDIYIKPDLTGITALDFNKFREGAERGRKAAEMQADRLGQLAVSEKEYLAWKDKLKQPLQTTPIIDEVQIAGMDYVNPEAVRKHIRAQPGEPLDTVQLERDLGRVYGDGDYEHVDYNLLSVRDRNILRITPTEESWGPNYLRFGLDLEASSKENDFALRAAYHRKWINSLGGEWLSGIQIGERDVFFTDFYQPLDERQRFFVEPSFRWSRTGLNVYEDDDRLAKYQIKERSAALNLGANIGVLGQIRVGRQDRRLDASVETGSTSLPSGENHLKGWSVALDFDQFDRAFFPTRGWAAQVRYFKEDDDYARLSADLRAAKSWGPYVFNSRLLYVGSPEGRLPVADSGTLGGFLTLSGYVRNQIIAGEVLFGSIRGEKIIGKMPLGLSGDMRLGVSLEAGKAKERFTETNREGWQPAGAIYLGGDTPVGPAYLGFGLAKGGYSAIYLFIGLP